MGTPTLSLLLIYLSLLVSVVHVAADSRPRPGTRLAAWSSVVDENGNVKACDVSKDKAKDRDAIVPRFYYQGIDNGIYEISWVPSNKNTGGSWSAPYLIVSPNDAAPNTPLAVVYYRLGSSTRVRIFYLISPDSSCFLCSYNIKFYRGLEANNLISLSFGSSAHWALAAATAP